MVSPRYAAWIAADAVAEGPRAQVFDYVARAATGRVVTGSKVHTVNTIEAPRVSELQLDMGVRLPVLQMPATSAFAAGGSDSFGYVSQARLFTQAALTDAVPVRPEFT